MLHGVLVERHHHRLLRHGRVQAHLGLLGAYALARVAGEENELGSCREGSGEEGDRCISSGR